MAAAFRANALGNDGITANTTTVAVTVPSGAAVGDVALVVIENNASGTTISTAPSGWTLKSGPDDNTASNTWLYAKTLASGEPGSSVTWTFSASTRPVATMTVFSGVTETGATYATPTTDTSSVSTLTVPTIASTPAGAAVVALFGRNRTGTSGTPADVTVASPYSQGATPRAASNFTGGTNASTEVAYQIAGGAGSYGGETLSITGGTSRGTTYLVALPATGGSTPASVTGATAVVRAFAPAGTASAAASITGATGFVRTLAPAGATSVAGTAQVIGTTGFLRLIAPAGQITLEPTVTGRTAVIRVGSVAGPLPAPGVNVTGRTAVITVGAPVGVVDIELPPLTGPVTAAWVRDGAGTASWVRDGIGTATFTTDGTGGASFA